ncbi:hypothetical protein V6N13_081099 [Hibiscus sabdariffa]
MPNEWHTPLEVPGNRLPETGSRRKLLNVRGAWQEVWMQELEGQLKRLRQNRSNIGNYKLPPVNLSEEYIFDCQTPIILPTTTPPAHTDNTADPSPARKRKKPAWRTTQADTPSDAADDSSATADFHVPPSNIKRQRHLHVISSASEDDGNTEPASSKSLAF